MPPFHLETALAAYLPADDIEKAHLQHTLHALNTVPGVFNRDQFQPGHITGSAYVVNPSFTRMCTIIHPTLKMPMMPGGHSDGNPDTWSVALREVDEELGLPQEKLLCWENARIFDVDTHVIPANPEKNEPEHIHFDIRFLFIYDGPEDHRGEEKIKYQWEDIAAVHANYPLGDGRRRCIDKLLKLRPPTVQPILDLLRVYLDDVNPITRAARTEGEELEQLLTCRHSFMGNVSKPFNGVRFAATAWVVNPLTRRFYTQKHRFSGKLWPCGGSPEPEDGGDMVKAALREQLEEAPAFKAVAPYLKPFDEPLLDVHHMKSIIPEKPGEWWILSIGFWAPPDVGTYVTAPTWLHLQDHVLDEDPAMARPAQRILTELRSFERYRENH